MCLRRTEKVYMARREFPRTLQHTSRYLHNDSFWNAESLSDLSNSHLPFVGLCEGMEPGIWNIKMCCRVSRALKNIMYCSVFIFCLVTHVCIIACISIIMEFREAPHSLTILSQISSAPRQHSHSHLPLNLILPHCSHRVTSPSFLHPLSVLAPDTHLSSFSSHAITQLKTLSRVATKHKLVGQEFPGRRIICPTDPSKKVTLPKVTDNKHHFLNDPQRTNY